MKKFLMLLIALTLMFNASAQWSVIKKSADELRGTEEKTIYGYSDNECDFVLDFEDQVSFAISSKNGIFDYNDNHRVKNVVGIYNENKVLLKKIEPVSLLVTDRASLASGYVCCPKMNKKYYKSHGEIKDFLKNEKGYVRFIVERYAQSNLDVYIPTLKTGGIQE